eukprot:GGOE01019797.1.p1 GENE.GGOE01019797.1~~GGOE01019797.1.p1  ORF type:complete len:1561 (-),score=529.51 GGOE01019797.1:223-4905(-)
MSVGIHIVVVSVEHPGTANGSAQHTDAQFILHFTAGSFTQALPVSSGASVDMEVASVQGQEPKLQLRLVRGDAAESTTKPLLEDSLDFPMWDAREPHLVHFVAPGVIAISLQLSWNILMTIRSPERSPRVPGKHIVTSMEQFMRSYAVPGSATVFDRELSTEGWNFVDGKWVKREYYRLQLTPQQKEVQRLIEHVILLTDQQLWDVHLYFLKIREEMSSQSAFDWCLELLAPFEHVCDRCEQYPLWSLLTYRICEMLRSVMQRMHERIVVSEATAEECLTRMEHHLHTQEVGSRTIWEERTYIVKLEETVRVLNERPTREAFEACRAELEQERQQAEHYRLQAVNLEHQVSELSLQAMTSPQRPSPQGELSRLQTIVANLQSRCEALDADARKFGLREEQLLEQIAVLEKRPTPDAFHQCELALGVERLHVAKLEEQLKLTLEQMDSSKSALSEDLLRERETALKQKAEMEALQRKWEKDRQRAEDMENMVSILEGLRPELKHFQDEVRRERHRANTAQQELQTALLQVQELKGLNDQQAELLSAQQELNSEDQRAREEWQKLQAALDEERQHVAQLEDSLAIMEPELHHLRQEVLELCRRPAVEVLDEAKKEAFAERSRAARLEEQIRQLELRPTQETLDATHADLLTATAEVGQLRASLMALQAESASGELEAIKEELVRERARSDELVAQLEEQKVAMDSPRAELMRARKALDKQEQELQCQTERAAQEVAGLTAALAQERSRMQALEQDLQVCTEQHGQVVEQLRIAQEGWAQDRARWVSLPTTCGTQGQTFSEHSDPAMQQLMVQLQAERMRVEQLECQLSILELRPTSEEAEAAQQKLRMEVVGLTEELRSRMEQLDMLQTQLVRERQRADSLEERPRVEGLTRELSRHQATIDGLQAQLQSVTTQVRIEALETVRAEAMRLEAQRQRSHADVVAELQGQLSRMTAQCAKLQEQVVSLEARPTLEELQAALTEAHEERATVHQLQVDFQRAREAAEAPEAELARQSALTVHLERELQVLEAKSRELANEMQMVLRRDQARLEQLEVVVENERRTVTEQRESMRQQRSRLDEVEAALQAARFVTEELRSQVEAERHRASQLEERVRGLVQRPTAEQWEVLGTEAATLRLVVKQLQEQVLALETRPTHDVVDALRRESHQSLLKVEELERRLADRTIPEALDGQRADLAREKARADSLEHLLQAKANERDATLASLQVDLAREREQVARGEAELKAALAATEGMRGDLSRERARALHLETEVRMLQDRHSEQLEIIRAELVREQAKGEAMAGVRADHGAAVERMKRLEQQLRSRPSVEEWEALQATLQLERHRNSRLERQVAQQPTAGEAETLVAEVQRLRSYIDQLEGQAKDRSLLAKDKSLLELLQTERARADNLSQQLQALRAKEEEARTVRLEWQTALQTMDAQRARIAALERELQRASSAVSADRRLWQEERHRLETSRADARTVHNRVETLEFELRTTRQALEQETQQRLQVQTANVHLESELARMAGVPLARSIRARSLSPKLSMRYEPLFQTEADSTLQTRRHSLGCL